MISLQKQKIDNSNQVRIKEIDSQISELENEINQIRPLLQEKHKEMMQFFDKVRLHYHDLCNLKCNAYYTLWNTFWELKDEMDKAEYLILVLKAEKSELDGTYHWWGAGDE